MEKFEVVLTDADKFSFASYFAKFIDFISSIVVRKILGPAVMGIYAELMLVFRYARYYHLGAYESLDREIPYFNGKGDYNKVEEIKRAGFNFAFFAALFMSICLILVSFFLPVDRKLNIGLRLIAMLVILQSISTYLVTLARTHHKFTILSKFNLLIAIVGTIITIILVIKFGLYGSLSASILVALIGIIYLFINVLLVRYFRVH